MKASLRMPMFFSLVMTMSCLVFGSTVFGQVTKTASTGNWNIAGTWSPSGVPASNDNVIIPSGVIVTLNTSITSSGSITLQGTGNLKFVRGNTLTVDGTINFQGTTVNQISWGGNENNGNQSTLNINGVLKSANPNGIVGANASIASASTDQNLNLSTTANYEFNGAANQSTTGLPATVNKLTINNTGTSPTNIVTLAGNVAISSATNSLTLTAGKLDLNNKQLTIPDGGTITATSGDFSSNTGTVAFTKVGTVSGTVTFPNVTTAGTVNFGAASTIGTSLQLNAGSYINPNSPTYATGSTLIYNTGGTYALTSGGSGTKEWVPGTNSGAGVPYNVIIGNGISGSALSFGSESSYRQANGSITISSNTGAALTLSTVSGGDLYVGGNFTNSGTFNANGRATTFNGTVAQTISGSGAIAFPFLTISNSSSSGVTSNTNVTVNSSPTTVANSFVINSSSTFTQASGTLSVNVSNGVASTIVNGTLVNQATITPSGSNQNTIVISSTGTYVHNTTSSASAILSPMSFNATSTMIFRGTAGGAQPSMSLASRNFGHLRFESTSGAIIFTPTSFGSGSTCSSNDFYIGSNVTLKLTGTGGTFAITGNVTTDGNINPDTGTPIFSLLGTSKTISGSTNAMYYQLNISGSYALSNNSPIVSSSSTITGTLDFGGSNILSGGGSFNANSGSTLKIGSTAGIVAGNTLFGNVQVIGGRTFDVGANYIYNGTASQATGTGLPSTVNTLTINNTGGSGFNIVTLTNAVAISNTTNSVTLTAGKLSLNSNQLSIPSGGTVTATSGDFALTAGTVAFLGSGTVSGTVTFPTVTISGGGVNFGSASTITTALQINLNGFINANAPIYASGSTLTINTGGTFDLNNGSNEAAGWYRNVVGTGSPQQGIPWNLTVSNNTLLEYNSANNDNFSRYINGSLTINSGSQFKLGGASGGDFYLRGDFTSAGTFNSNTRAVNFIGGNTQNLTLASPFNIDYVVLNKSGGSVVLQNNLLVEGPNNNTNALALTNSTDILDLNGKTFTLGKAGVTSTISGNGFIKGSIASNVSILGNGALGTLRFVQTTPGTTNALSNFTVDRQSSGTITIGNDLVSVTALTLTNGTVDIGSNALTLKGTISNTSGTVTASAGTITFGGSGAQTALAAAFTSSSFKNLNISNGNTVTITGNFSIAIGGTMTVNSSATFIPGSTGDVISGAGTLTGVGAVQVKSATGTNDYGTQYSITKSPTNTLTVQFVGTALQGAGSGITYNSLQTINSNGVKLNGDISITNTTATSLVLTTGDLDLNGQTLTLSGGINYGSGKLKTTSSSGLVLGGTGVSLNFTTNPALVKTLTLNTGATATLVSAVNVTAGSTPGIVTVNTGATLTTGGNLTLKSDANGTALVGTSAGSISGNVTMERYIPIYSNRRYRLLTAPVTGTTINAAWQEGQKWDGTGTIASTGYGTLITGRQQGNAATANANGFDFWPAVSNSDASILKYVGAPNSANAGLDSLANTTRPDAFGQQQAYFVFIRGDRSVYSGTPATPGITTLRATGTLKQGAQTATVSKTNSHTLIGNPYPAPLDFQSLYTVNSSAIQNSFYVWTAGVGTSRGTYTLVRPVSGGCAGCYEDIPSGSNTPGTGTVNKRLIASSEGFFVMPQTGLSTDPVINFAESNKSTGTPDVNTFRTQRTATLPSKLYVSLSTDVGGVKTPLDGVLSEYDASYDQTSGDLSKAINGGENVTLYKNSKDLVVATGPFPKNGDVLQLRIWNTSAKNYLFDFKSMNFAALGLTAVLDDNFTHTQTPISLNDAVTPIAFTITSDAASKDTLRFRILFSGGVLPLQLTSLKAAEKSGGVNVEWTVANETDIKGYEVEKSVDGNAFSKLASVAASGAQAYVSFDAQPAPVNYYRVKLLGTAGESKYSSVVKVSLQRRGEGIQLYPNPLLGNTLQVQLINKPQGVYTVSLYNTVGQRLLSKTISHQGGSATETLELKNSFASGLYKVEVKNNNGEKVVQTLTLLK